MKQVEESVDLAIREANLKAISQLIIAFPSDDRLVNFSFKRMGRIKGNTVYKRFHFRLKILLSYVLNLSNIESFTLKVCAVLVMFEL